MPQNSQNLVITNKDRKDISIDCKFESKPWLDFEFEPLVLKDRKHNRYMFVDYVMLQITW